MRENNKQQQQARHTCGVIKTQSNGLITTLDICVCTGVLNFQQDEKSKDIMIPVVNDPTGKSASIIVDIDDVIGRNEIGEMKSCTIYVMSEKGTKLSCFFMTHRIQ